MTFNDIQDTLCDMELNLEKILKLPESDKNIILGLYNDLCDCFYGEKGVSMPGGMKIDHTRLYINYNTLINNEYLVNKRGADLEKILG